MATLVDGLPFPAFATSLPAADRTSLIGLGDAEVRAWTITRASEYRRFALALLSIHNSIAPIDRLPIEILSNIFERCWARRDSLGLAHICRRWRSILLNRTSAFWADAVSGAESTSEHRSLDYLDAILQRSVPREVETRFLGFSPEIHHHLTPHVHRLVVLQVTALGLRDIEVLWQALKAGMPCLQTLAIFLAGDDRDLVGAMDIEPLSPTALPRLIRLTAPGSLFSDVAVPSLRHLSLQRFPAGRGINLIYHAPTFWESIATCPNLETLELLEVASWTWTDEPPPVSRPPVSLPALQSVHVKDRAVTCADILSCLAFPETTRIHCTATNASGLRAVLPMNSVSLHAVLNMINRVMIQYDSRTVAFRVCCYANDEQVLRVDCESFFADDLAVFRLAAPVTRLEIFNVSQNRIDFHSFPHLSSASIRGRDAAHILDQLGIADEDGGLVSPDLRTLTVHFSFSSFTEPRIGEALRGGSDSALVESYLRRQCAAVERVVSSRARMGCRLAKLEFGCVEVHPLTLEPAGPECTLDVMSSGDKSWQSVMQSLRTLVDGTVTFTGYRFFAQGPK